MNDHFSQHLKPGDKVIVSPGGCSRSDSISKVKRLTKTQIILDTDGRFRRKDGCVVSGDQWARSRLREWTVERSQKIRHGRLIVAIQLKVVREHLEQFSLTKLTAIYKLLK